ncbi:MAG: racemase, partial [Betaproteobacteria bacterium]|nr:racemase [Betaproteobacteria bacterium]
MIRIWHQSFTELHQLPAYQQAMDAHVRRVVRPDTEVVLHGVKPGTYPGNYPGTDIAHSALYTLHASQWITQALKASDEGFDA